MVLDAKIPDMSIKAKRPPISPPFNLSKLDLIKSIDNKTIVALREEIFKDSFESFFMRFLKFIFRI